jgi:superfamily II helicase
MKLYEQKRLATLRFLKKVKKANEEGSEIKFKDLTSSSQMVIVAPLKEDGFLKGNGHGFELTEIGIELLHQLQHKKKNQRIEKNVKSSDVKKYAINIEGNDGFSLKFNYFGKKAEILKAMAELE